MGAMQPSMLGNAFRCLGGGYQPLLRRTLAWVVALSLLLGAAGQNADPIEAPVQGLRRDPVFIDPAAQRTLSDTEAERLREQIRSAGTPVFVAVLPTSAGTRRT